MSPYIKIGKQATVQCLRGLGGFFVRAYCLLPILAAWTSPALSQVTSMTGEDTPRAAFSGAYAGPELGLHEHHFYVEETDRLSGKNISSRYYRGWGVGGGVFAGYDQAVGERIHLGVEANLSVGGNDPVARFSDGTTFRQDPQWGYRVTAKVGYRAHDRLLAYGTFGYGGHRYRLVGRSRVEDTREFQSSFTIGGGLQYRLNERTDVRLDFRHLDNSMSSLLVGLPVRF